MACMKSRSATQHARAEAWSADYLRVIGKVEPGVRDLDTLAVAMPRGCRDHHG